MTQQKLSALTIKSAAESFKQEICPNQIYPSVIIPLQFTKKDVADTFLSKSNKGIEEEKA